MKCIRCGTDNTYRERSANSGTCKKCKQAFVFEPKSSSSPCSPHLTDTKMKAALEKLAAGGRLRFTARQLWYAISPRRTIELRRRAVILGWTLAIAGAVAAFILGDLFNSGAVLIGGFVLSGFFALFGMSRASARVLHPGVPDMTFTAPKVLYSEFKAKALPAWEARHGAIAALIDVTKQVPAPYRRQGDEAPPDLLDYGFDAAIVTDTDENAKLLVANGFHTEVRAIVVSAEGFPGAPLRAELIDAVRRQPRPVVIVTHDASAAGVRLARSLRAPAWFPDRAQRIIDVGLRPAQVWHLRLPVVEGDPRSASTAVATSQDYGAGDPDLPALSVHEQRWLALGYRAELSALGNERWMGYLRKRLARARAQAEAELTGASSDGGDDYHDSGWGIFYTAGDDVGSDTDGGDSDGDG
jgi:hypothetical protein